MLRPLIYIIFILFTTLVYKVSYAQYAGNTSYDFAPGDKVIFEDDFSRDTVGAFPAHWHISPCNKYMAPKYADKQFWKVQKDGDEHELVIKSTIRHIDPDMNVKYYLRDSFTVDFDFRFDTLGGCAELYFYTYEHPDSCYKMCVHIHYKGTLYISGNDNHNEFSVNYPGHFAYKAWHHFALAYKERAIDFYIDKYRVASLPDCRFSPYGIALGCIAPVIYKHFRITTGKDNNPFTKIITEKKFVTHAINFDVNKSSIKPESRDFIMKLAQFLKANHSIKLEIDGYTDSDGDAAANMKLSKARADEVKKQLVSAGIDAGRLTTKGFGASKPLQPNTTPEGKANNRRVGFLKR